MSSSCRETTPDHAASQAPQQPRFAARRVCVVLAHPDDEVFIAGTLYRHLEQGAQVHGLWLTSGDARGGGRRREAELSRALALLGLEPESMRLPRFPNGGLLAQAAEAAAWLARTLAALKPELLYVTAYEGGHIEHDVANRITRDAWRSACPEATCLEFPLYNRTGPRIMGGWRINGFPLPRQNACHARLSRQQVRCKFAMMRCHRSQWRDMLPFRLAMPGWRYRKTGEPAAPLPAGRDYSIPPHPGELNYERNPGKQRFAEFAAAMAALPAPAA